MPADVTTDLLAPFQGLPAWYWALCGALLGGVLASFACVVVERVPAGLPLTGRSRCACGRVLGLRENVPVLGWVLSGGTARCCGSRIPAWYVLAEAGAVAALGVLGWAGGPAGVAVGAAAGTALTVLAVRARRRR